MSKEMRKFASILFALVLVLSFTLIPPAPVAAATAISKVIDRQLAVNTQSTQSWKEAASITLTQDGSWLVFTSFDFGVDDTGTNGEVRLQQDGTTELQYGRYEDKESGETYKSWFWMTRVERSGSNVDLDLDFQPRGSDTARICNAIIAAIRLDDLGTEDTDWRWNEEEAEHGNLGITWTAANNIILTETWTPSAEDWLIIANMEIRSDDTSENAEGRLSLNDETPVYDFATEEAEDGSEWRWWSSVRLLTLPGSEQKFEIQARSTENDTDARRARFFAVRKACFDQVVEFRDDTYAAPSAINTWEEKVDAYFTPNQTEDVLILGHAGIDFGHEDRYGRTRVHEEETDELMHSDYTTADDSDLAPVAFADIFTNWDTSTHDADLDINASNTGVTFGHAAVIFVSLTLPAAVPGITVNPTSGLDTTEAGGTDTFTVVLNTQPSAGVTVGISSDDTSEGTVLPTSLTFTSLNWSTAQTVTLTGEDDDVDDGDIPYNIATAAAVSGDGDYNGINPADVSVTNQDDDTAGVTIAETAGSTNVDEEGPTSDTYSVVLDSEPTDDVVISITPDAQVTVDPTALTFGSGNWSTPQDVTVTAVDDAVIEWAHTGTITHSASSGDVKYNGISIDDVITNIADNDGADVAIQLAMILDGSGSTSSGDWSIIKNGLAAAIEGGVLCPQRSATNNTGVFSDPTNAYADSGDYATATNGQVHQYYGYNFTIPDGATINGIEVRLDAWRETFTDASIAVELSWDGGGNWTSLSLIHISEPTRPY